MPASRNVSVLCGDCLSVGRIGRKFRDGREKRFIEEHLADVGNVATGVIARAVQCTVDVHLIESIRVFEKSNLNHLEMDVGGAAGIPSGKDGIEGHSSAAVGDLKSSKESRIGAALVVRILKGGINTDLHGSTK